MHLPAFPSKAREKLLSEIRYLRNLKVIFSIHFSSRQGNGDVSLGKRHCSRYFPGSKEEEKYHSLLKGQIR